MTLPSCGLYIVYSISNSPYQQWQADLLDFSVRATDQPGVIVRLVSQEAGKPNEPIGQSAVGYTVATPAYSELNSTIFRRLVLRAKRWMKWDIHGRLHFYCLNKALAMNYFLESHPELDEEAIIVWLDPDMIFSHAWEPDSSMVRPGHVLGQYWWGYDQSWCQRHGGGNSEAACPAPEAAIMFPFCISVADMRRIVRAYGSVSETIYRSTRDWKSEMYGLVIAMGVAGLHCRTLRAFGTCNNWPSAVVNDPGAPISHYTQAMLDSNGNEIWDKRKYTPHTLNSPWRRPPSPEHAASLTDQRTLRMIHRFIDTQISRG